MSRFIKAFNVTIIGFWFLIILFSSSSNGAPIIPPVEGDNLHIVHVKASEARPFLIQLHLDFETTTKTLIYEANSLNLKIENPELNAFFQNVDSRFSFFQESGQFVINIPIVDPMLRLVFIKVRHKVLDNEASVLRASEIIMRESFIRGNFSVELIAPNRIIIRQDRL